MRALGARALATVGLVVAVLAYAVARSLDDHGVALPLPWTSPAVVAFLALVVVLVGWPVRRYNRGQRDERFDPLRAARAGVLAQAAAVTGAALAGVYAAMALVLAPTAPIEPRRADLVRALVAFVAALLLLAAGVVVQRWCRLPPDDDEQVRQRVRRERDADRAADDEHDDSHSHADPPGSSGHRGSR